VDRQPFGGYRMSGIGSKAGGADDWAGSLADGSDRDGGGEVRGFRGRRIAHETLTLPFHTANVPGSGRLSGRQAKLQESSDALPLPVCMV